MRDFGIQLLKVLAVWVAFLAHPVVGIMVGAVVIADVGVGHG